MKIFYVIVSVLQYSAFFLLSACYQVVDMRTPKLLTGDKTSPGKDNHSAKIPPEKRKLYLVESFAAQGCLTLNSHKTFVATFQANSGFEFRTLAFPSALSFDNAVARAKALAEKNKLEFIALVNAGFFNDGGSGEALSYFESSLLKRRHAVGNARGTRPCFVSENGTKISWEKIGANAPKRQAQLVIDTACAGPMLLQEGRDVLESSLKEGEFAPKYRKDGGDPLSLQGRRSRTAICLRENGSIRLFATNQYACGGMTILELQKYLKDFGCVDAMAFDGGASTGFYAIGNTGGVEHSLKSRRKVPIWLAVFYRTDL